MSSAQQDLEGIAREVIQDSFHMDPVGATWMGEHTFDSLLPDLTKYGQGQFAQRIEGYLTALDAVDDVELALTDLVDLEILRAFLTRAHFDITQVAAHTWNPMLWNPGTAIHLLLSRDFAPLEERMANVADRCENIPDFLEQARNTLEEMPAIHCETAIAQLAGTRALLESLDIQPQIIQSLDQHVEWLKEQLPFAHKSPRMGSEIYSGILWHSLDAESSAQELLVAAHQHLDLVNSQMLQVAQEYLAEIDIEIEENGDPISCALAQIAESAPVTDSTVLSQVASAMAAAKAFTIERDLVTVPEIDVEVIQMPEIHRGVAVAYCDAPGPLEQAHVPTFVAVAPTPAQWASEHKESFFREYNGVQIHDLTIHEAIPGHVLQLAVASHGSEQSLTRRFGFSGTFVEGWAVYVEELLISQGYSPEPTKPSALAIRLQQLKMQARMSINAILDVSVHTQEIDEDEAMSLMINRGYQEESEAAGKWRRALLTAGQLPTYFVGYREVRQLAEDLRLMHPDWSWREIHDLMLQFGSPAPRHVRQLLGL
ncbi:MAG: DUF885 domain-containing protein [Candidatus Nanopelagicales bacterium]|nr:DUF885 domain-containing protein [Candidatus Nanopelagicales bacterium]